MRKSNTPYSYLIALSVLILILVGTFYHQYQKEQSYCKLYIAGKIPKVYEHLKCERILSPKNLEKALNDSKNINWN